MNIYLKNIEWFAQFILSETYGWTSEERGLYIELLCIAVNNNGNLEAGLNGVPAIIRKESDTYTWNNQVKHKWTEEKYGQLKYPNFLKMLETVNAGYFEQDQKPGMLYPSKAHLSKDLTEDEINNSIAYVDITAKKLLKAEDVEVHWKGFKIQHFNGKGEYKSWDHVIQHFRDWTKKYYLNQKQIDENGANNKTANRGNETIGAIQEW